MTTRGARRSEGDNFKSLFKVIHINNLKCFLIIAIIMKKNPQYLLFIFIFSLILFSRPIYADQESANNNIAILQLEVTGGIPSTYAPALTDRLRQEIFQTGAFKIMERGEMNEILKEIGFQMSGCTSNECVVEAGRMLGVSQMLAGNVSQMGEMHTVTIRLIDVQTSEIIRIESVDCFCTINEVLTTKLRQVARKLAGAGDDDVIDSGDMIGLGNIRISSSPSGATVYLDGEETENKTPTVLSQISAGKHLIRLEKGGLHGSKQIYILPDMTSDVEVELKKGLGACTIDSDPPSADIFLDDRLIGTSPVKLDTLTSGKHLLTARAEGYIEHRQEITISVNERTSVKIKLMKYGGIYIRSEPPGSDVSIGREKMGATPLHLPEITPGKYQIALRHLGYQKHEFSVETHSGAIDTFRFELLPIAKSSALLRSAIIPGTGQIYSGHKIKGAGILLGEAAAGYLAYHFIRSHSSAVDEYHEARRAYKAAVYLEEMNSTRTEMDDKYDECAELKLVRNVILGFSAAIYLYNIVDIAFLTNYPQNNGGFGFNMNSSGSGESIQLAMTYRF